MKIGNFDTTRNVLIVAEIGNNHEGSFDRAKGLIELAKLAGAHAVKFQTIVPERLVAPSQVERRAVLGRFQLSYHQFAALKDFADSLDILFLSTPFDVQSAEFLAPLVPAFKIASGDNNFQRLLAAVAATHRPILLSTGMTDLESVRRSCNFIVDEWKRIGCPHRDLAVLHCATAYPTPLEQAGLGAIVALKTLGFEVGYSDHTLGIQAALTSVACGARIIEKHFTSDKAFSSFRDHQLSADPTEMRELVARVAELEQMLGSNEKRIAPCEEASLSAARRGPYATRDLAAGARLSAADVEWLRPAGTLDAFSDRELTGKTLSTAKQKGERLEREDLS